MARNPRGNIERRGRGWWLRLARKDPAGQARPERIFLGKAADIRTATQARARADAWLAINRPAPALPGPAALTADALERFLKLAAPSLKSASQVRYARLLRRYAIPHIGSTPIAEINTARLRELFAELTARGIARSTLVSLRSVLIRALGEARIEGLVVGEIDAKRIKLIALSAVVPRKITPVTRAELEQILDGSAWPWRALFGLLGYAGLRIGEALAMCWEDVDLERHQIHIRSSASATGLIQSTKTDGSAATLPMLPELERLLGEYREICSPGAAGLLFATRSGRAHGQGNIRQRVLWPVLQRLGLGRRGFHSFRHGLPRMLFDAGIAPDLIRALMRHANMRETERYIHADAATLRAALDAASGRLSTQRNSMQSVTNSAQSDAAAAGKPRSEI